MAWYVMFRDRKPRVYESWGVCSEYVVGFSGTAFYSYSIRMHVEEVYVAFLEHQNQDRKPEQVARNPEDAVNKRCWKYWVILVQFVVVVIL
jgi:viroplasmin and RNaseH domain-containing protein